MILKTWIDSPTRNVILKRELESVNSNYETAALPTELRQRRNYYLTILLLPLTLTPKAKKALNFNPEPRFFDLSTEGLIAS